MTLLEFSGGRVGVVAEFGLRRCWEGGGFGTQFSGCGAWGGVGTMAELGCLRNFDGGGLGPQPYFQDLIL